MPVKPRKGARVKRKERKNIESGIAHIRSTFNNTIITITDTHGNVLSWSTSGHMGYKGSKKSTPYAAQMAAETAAKAAMEHGLRQIEVLVKGPGSGREAAIRSLQAAGLEVNMLLRFRTTAAVRLNAEESDYTGGVIPLWQDTQVLSAAFAVVRVKSFI